eukprot:7091912-Prymnesium_polylepis.1
MEREQPESIERASREHQKSIERAWREHGESMERCLRVGSLVETVQYPLTACQPRVSAWYRLSIV